MILEKTAQSETNERELVQAESLAGDQVWENQLRPAAFDEFPGQEDVKARLRVATQAAKERSEPLDHVLLSGPPGLGKTTLARILAFEMGAELRITSAPALEKRGDLAAILTSLRPFSVLFIDEIHRLPTALEEYLYTAMEDYYIDIVMGDGMGARSMKFQLAPFTLVGATTRSGLLTGPLRDRFGILERLNFYKRQDLETILTRSSQILGIQCTPEGASEMASRARGTPRIANRLLKRVRDYAQVAKKSPIDAVFAATALDQLGVDRRGLDGMDRRYLETLATKFGAGPVGVDTLAAALAEDADTLEEVVEPYLMQEGYLQKTARGRVLTDLGRNAVAPGK